MFFAMKRLVLIVSLLLSIPVWAAGPGAVPGAVPGTVPAAASGTASAAVSGSTSAAASGKNVSKARIAAAISQCRNYDGVEMVELGRIKTAALKGVIRIAAMGDSDARDALALMKGIHRITILDYEDSSDADKARIEQRLECALSGSEMLMEASDGGDKMRIYGVVEERAEIVRDFVLYAPSDCALICIFGSISMDTIAKITSDD